jgi:hypothetical protein
MEAKDVFANDVDRGGPPGGGDCLGGVVGAFRQQTWFLRMERKKKRVELE